MSREILYGDPQTEVIRPVNWLYAIDKLSLTGSTCAFLSDGDSSILLPQLAYRCRTTFEPGTPHAEEAWTDQNAVHYAKLDLVAQKAVELALTLEVDPAEPPRYKRLALHRTDNEAGDNLCTVAHRIGYDQSFSLYPEEIRAMDAEPKLALGSLVATAKTVSDGYFVTRHDAADLSELTYQDNELNAFGPASKDANAFWVVGNPRRVWSDTDARLSPQDTYAYEILANSRHVIMPIRFMQVVEEIQS